MIIYAKLLETKPSRLHGRIESSRFSLLGHESHPQSLLFTGPKITARKGLKETGGALFGRSLLQVGSDGFLDFYHRFKSVTRQSV
jgi:hypothetical protein